MSSDLFAYGSNMHAGDLRAWFEARGPHVPSCDVVGAALLRGWRLEFNIASVRRGGGVANVVPAAGEAVYGVLLRVDEHTLASIDRKEGAYDRVELELELAGVPAAGWVYVGRADRVSADFLAPSRAYLDLLIDSARRFAFPDDYLRRLEALGAGP